MPIRYTDKSRGVAALVRMDVPWPVNPALYPLTGRTAGPVYTPPPKRLNWAQQLVDDILHGTL